MLARAELRHFAVGDRPTVLPLHTARLSDTELKTLHQLVEIVDERPEGLLVRRNARYVVGRCAIGGISVAVPPAFDPRLMVGMMLYAIGVETKVLTRLPELGVPLATTPDFDYFVKLMSALLVQQAEGILRRHVAQSWMPVVERSLNPKGRILWTEDFGRRPSDGITHSRRLKTTDTNLNRVLLRGLTVAASSLSDTVMRGRASRVVFAWRELASPVHLTAIDFYVAERDLNRLVDHYAPALALSKALVLGLEPTDYFAPGREPRLPSLVFSLPAVFERFVQRLLTEAARGDSQREVRAQLPDRAALLDEYGRLYAEVRPDLELRVSGVPAAVVDAKFKPRYVSGADTRKLSTADVYQLLFYKARARQRAGFDVPAAVVAPKLDDIPMSHGWPREVVWRQADGPDEIVRVLSLPMRPLLDALARQDARLALQAAPELLDFLQQRWLVGSAKLATVP